MGYVSLPEGKGNQWLISPDDKAGYFWGWYVGGGRLTSHD